MKTKFSVEIHKDGKLNEQILRVITNHNAGDIYVPLTIFKDIVEVNKATYPIIYKSSKCVIDEGVFFILNIFENDMLTLSITEKIIIGSIEGEGEE